MSFQLGQRKWLSGKTSVIHMIRPLPYGAELWIMPYIWMKWITVLDCFLLTSSRLFARGGLKVIADSADPRLIQEIHNGGIKIYAVEKGAGSINAGIDKMKDMEIYITKRSYNLQSEFRKYVWAKDKDGNYINEPEDHDNHGIDAVRYYVLGELLGKIQKPKDLTGIFTH